MKFKATVNAFLRSAVVEGTLDDKTEKMCMYFDDIDEWFAFRMFDRWYDVHFHYEDTFTLSIYLAGSMYMDQFPVKTKVIIKGGTE